MGYFASIARQSGVRFSAERTGAREARAVQMAPSEPLDREETVMIDPPAQEHVRQPDAPAWQTPLANADARQESREKPDIPATEMSAPPISVSSSPFRTPEPISERSPITPPDVATRNSPAIDITDAVAAIGSDPPARRVIESARVVGRPEVLERASETKAAVAPEQVLSETPSPKRYFERTAEIVEGRDASPAESRAVVLREVQEWIAAGLAPESAILEPALQRPAEPIAPEEAQRVVAPEPGVVRIGARPRGNEERSPSITQPVRFDEQQFELSIGTISIEVEGEESSRTPLRNAPPQHISKEARQQAPRQGSRMSRHYL